MGVRGRRHGRGRGVRRRVGPRDAIAGPAGQLPQLAGHPAFWGFWQAGESVGSVRVNEPGCPIWHELSSPNLPVATKFYSDVLGVEWESMPMETGDDYTCLMVDGRPVAGAFPPHLAGIPPHWDGYFNVEDCDATVARALELGAGELVAPYDLPGVGRTAMVRDPQGALAAFLQNPPEDPSAQ